MRSVDKGESPEEFRCYQDAKKYLQKRLGHYCSYCERKVDVGLAVEHKLPKKYNTELILQWSNFLLSCSNCNSCKGHSNINEMNYIWPDKDETLSHFTYENGLVATSNNCECPEKAAALIQLVGLDRTPDHDLFSPHDNRWLNRKEIYDMAQKWRSAFDESKLSIDLIINAAVLKGGFSIWMEVFSDIPELCSQLIEEFPGTKAQQSTYPAQNNSQ